MQNNTTLAQGADGYIYEVLLNQWGQPDWNLGHRVHEAESQRILGNAYVPPQYRNGQQNQAPQMQQQMQQSPQRQPAMFGSSSGHNPGMNTQAGFQNNAASSLFVPNASGVNHNPNPFAVQPVSNPEVQEADLTALMMPRTSSNQMNVSVPPVEKEIVNSPAFGNHLCYGMTFQGTKFSLLDPKSLEALPVKNNSFKGSVAIDSTLGTIFPVVVNDQLEELYIEGRGMNYNDHINNGTLDVQLEPHETTAGSAKDRVISAAGQIDSSDIYVSINGTVNCYNSREEAVSVTKLLQSMETGLKVYPVSYSKVIPHTFDEELINELISIEKKDGGAWLDAMYNFLSTKKEALGQVGDYINSVLTNWLNEIQHYRRPTLKGTVSDIVSDYKPMVKHYTDTDKLSLLTDSVVADFKVVLMLSISEIEVGNDNTISVLTDEKIDLIVPIAYSGKVEVGELSSEFTPDLASTIAAAVTEINDCQNSLSDMFRSSLSIPAETYTSCTVVTDTQELRVVYTHSKVSPRIFITEVRDI